MDYLDFLTSMTVSQYRAFRRALAVMMRAGVSKSDAMHILMMAHENRRNSKARIAEYLVTGK